MTTPAVMGTDAAAWGRTHVWTRDLRRDHDNVPGLTHRCPCQWGPCGHCAADRHDQRVHERHPEAAGQPTPEDWLTTPHGLAARHLRARVARRPGVQLDLPLRRHPHHTT
ncbi:hypothetical protein FB384_005330, partial [Prauserella sediminis]